MIYIYRHRKQQKQKDFNPFLEYSSATFEMKLMHTQPQNSDRQPKQRKLQKHLTYPQT